MKPEDFGIGKYKFNSDGTLDVFQDVKLYYKNLIKLPFEFGKIDGNFDCSSNNLTSLKGAPKIVNGNFDCHWNKLKYLKSALEIVNGEYNCSHNNLTSLEGAPEEVNGDFWCSFNQLKSLKGLNLDNISGEVYVHRNINLKLTEKEKLWATLNPGRLILK